MEQYKVAIDNISCPVEFCTNPGRPCTLDYPGVQPILPMFIVLYHFSPAQHYMNMTITSTIDSMERKCLKKNCMQDLNILNLMIIRT